jgi:hypothetical protein
MERKHITSEINKLDPVNDHQQMVHLLVCYAFPWDWERAMEFALFRTFAVPSGSELLLKTGEFTNRPRKRYDDTELLMYETIENGYDSERSRRALRRVNQMHGRYHIPNREMLYVLSTFIYEPVRWMEQNAWRPLTSKEKVALFLFVTEVGRRMGIKDIPAHYDSFEQFNRKHEKENFRYAESNRLVGDATVNLLLSFYLPSWAYPLGRTFLYAMMDDLLLEAMKYPKPHAFTRKIIRLALNTRKSIQRYARERTTPCRGTARRRKTYPKGYRIEELGTFPGR